QLVIVLDIAGIKLSARILDGLGKVGRVRAQRAEKHRGEFIPNLRSRTQERVRRDGRVESESRVGLDQAYAAVIAALKPGLQVMRSALVRDLDVEGGAVRTLPPEGSRLTQSIVSYRKAWEVDWKFASLVGLVPLAVR